MDRPVVLLARPESLLAEHVAGILTAGGLSTLILDIDAPINGEPVTVRDDHVCWQGHDLAAAAAIWLEEPVFPWPQMVPPPCPLPDVANFQRWRHYQREARSLAVAAMSVAGASVPVLNPVGTFHLAVAPTVALDRLAAAGLPVHQWRVTCSTPSPGELTIDAVGHDRWHRPTAVPAGSPRLCFAPAAGAVMELLLIGGDVAAARHWTQAADWTRSNERPQAATLARFVESTEVSAPLVALGRRCAAVLELEILQVACLEGGQEPAVLPAVLLADAAPDLAAWDVPAAGHKAAAQDVVAIAIARRLAALAASR